MVWRAIICVCLYMCVNMHTYTHIRAPSMQNMTWTHIMHINMQIIIYTIRAVSFDIYSCMHAQVYARTKWNTNIHSTISMLCVCTRMHLILAHPGMRPFHTFEPTRYVCMCACTHAYLCSLPMGTPFHTFTPYAAFLPIIFTLTGSKRACECFQIMINVMAVGISKRSGWHGYGHVCVAYAYTCAYIHHPSHPFHSWSCTK